MWRVSVKIPETTISSNRSWVFVLNLKYNILWLSRLNLLFFANIQSIEVNNLYDLIII